MEKTQMLPLLKMQESYKLTVTKELEKQIRFLCDKLPDNEWSGTVFYTVEGSFKDKNLHIICKDFFLQDIGEATYTEFTDSADIVSYMVEHELLDYYTGILHSHNKMKAFHSGTDLQTLQREGTDSNHCLSLVVNNNGIYDANITRKAVYISEGSKNVIYNTFDNVDVTEEGLQFRSEETFIEYYPLEINIEKIPQKPKTELELRLEEIQAATNSYINRNKSILSFNNISTPDSLDKKVSKPVQVPLFDVDTLNSYAEEKNFQVDYDAIDYENEYIDSGIIKDTVTQIITGDIFSIYKQNVDINKWAAHMENLYDKRFGAIVTEYDSFEYWVDSFTEFLENEIIDDSLITKGRDKVDAIWAYNVIKKLEEFPENRYIKAFIHSLERFLI